MKLSLASTLLLSSVALGCAGASDGPRDTPPSTSAAPSTSSVASTTPTASASTVVGTPPSPDRWTELEDAPGATELDAGAAAIKKEDWNAAERALGPAVEALRPSGRVDQKMAGSALLGRALVHASQRARAEKEFASVLELWKGDETVARLSGDAPDEPTRKDRLRRALLAVGEAMFFFAEEKRAAADKIQFPTMVGRGDTAAIKEFIDKKVVPWVKKKRPAIQEADDAYVKIAKLEPAPPPHWLVDAAARVGEMKAAFAASFRAAPLPKEWMQEGRVPGAPDITWADMRVAYYTALDSAAAPLVAEARSAFEACVSASKRFDWVDDFSKGCEAWLAKN